MNYNTPGMGFYGSTWEAHGYSGKGNVSDLIDSIKGRTAVIVGNAKGCFEQAEFIIRKTVDPVIFAVNDVGMFLPKIHHWVSYHGDQFPQWKSVRWIHVKQEDRVFYHSYGNETVCDFDWNSLNPMFTLSGCFAMQIAYIMGAEKIILCGCPMDDTPRFFDCNSRPDFNYGGGKTQADLNVRQQLINEMNRLPEFKQKVWSMNGWTSKYFNNKGDM